MSYAFFTMKDFSFYHELKDKRAGESSGNCLAVFGKPFGMDFAPPQHLRECVAAIFDEPNSVCCGSSTTIEHLRQNCKRISESSARVLHPNLFKYLGAPVESKIVA